MDSSPICQLVDEYLATGQVSDSDVKSPNEDAILTPLVRIRHSTYTELDFSSRTSMRTAALDRAYFNVPTGTDVLGDLKSVLEGLVTRA